jgi:hypothetical protein
MRKGSTAKSRLWIKWSGVSNYYPPRTRWQLRERPAPRKSRS